MRHQTAVHHRLQIGNRRAVVTVMVLIVMLLMSAMVAQFVRRAVSDRRQVRTELQYRQAVQLAETGVQRLARRRSADPEYSGETWTIPPGTVHQTNSGRIEISLKDDTATVIARYPFNNDNPFKVTRTVRLPK